MLLIFNPDCAVASYCDLKILSTKLVSRFLPPWQVAPRHINEYAYVIKSLQLRVSLWFSAPRYEFYFTIWV
jgi:hypothetical protein